MKMHDEVETCVINGLSLEMERDLTLADRFSERVGDEVIVYDLIMKFRLI